MGAHGSVMQLADKPRVRQWQLLLLLPAGFLLVLFIVSLGAIANLSVNGPQGLTLEHYARFLSTPVYAYVPAAAAAASAES